MYIFWNLKNWFVVILMSFLFIFSVPEKILAAEIAVIESADLYQSLSTWVIFDARPFKQWQQGHIPGAKSFSWEDYTRTDEKGIAYRTLPPELLAAALGKMGIDENSPVVVYGDADTSWGGEGWACWVLAWMGHKAPIRMLNGGIQSWLALKLPVQSNDQSVAMEPKIYRYQILASINITADDIRKNPSAFQLVDNRSTLEWIKGRIPGAIHIPWEKFYTDETRRPLTPVETKELLIQKGVNPERPVVYYCAGGIRSAYAWLVHHWAGLPEAINFEGGMEEWEKTSP
jgi:thiosulfate/3-mercaptopyruvate sulfurtransferase